MSSTCRPFRRLHCAIVSSVVLALLLPALASAALRVDINAPNDRKDMLSRQDQNWTLPKDLNGGAKVSQTFDAVTVTLRPIDKGGIEGSWWKGGIDTGAPLSTDGAANKTGGIEIVLSGLTPGRHSLATYHNIVSGDKLGPCTVSVVGGKAAASAKVTPSDHVRNDYDVATGYVEFDAEAGKEVVVAIKP